MELLRELPLLHVTDRTLIFSGQILASGLLPATARLDAAHIALATVQAVDLLLSWNCRHFANAAIQARLRRLAEASALTLSVICTPEELLDQDYENNH